MTKMTFDIYGFKEIDLDILAKETEQLFSIQLTGRYSSFIGKYWLYKPDKSGEQIKLQTNYSEEEQDWQLPKHQEYNVLMYISSFTKSAFFETLVKERFGDRSTLLRRNVDELK